MGITNLPVDTGGIGLPNIDDCSRNGLAGVHVDVLHLEEYIDTLRVQLFLDILAHDLTPDVVWTVSDGGRQDKASVGTEDNRLRSRGAVIKDASAVVVDSLPFLQSGKVTAPFLGNLIHMLVSVL